MCIRDRYMGQSGFIGAQATLTPTGIRQGPFAGINRTPTGIFPPPAMVGGQTIVGGPPTPVLLGRPQGVVTPVMPSPNLRGPGPIMAPPITGGGYVPRFNQPVAIGNGLQGYLPSASPINPIQNVQNAIGVPTSRSVYVEDLPLGRY
eukprot:TRINITY_DN12567_c0_g1_i4.p1 TRINITY_DN12567_c0_g1~~TRINITY_DN12567_c0_g1_i4.p1  ORF type:complete len:147 (+),score=33.16 TRINITY_DN12567_c0_g1_i4:64-504(+)